MPKTDPPTKLHRLQILTMPQALSNGYTSITIDIHSVTESVILEGVCQHRNPDRACLARTARDTYQLCIRREDISDLKDDFKKDY